MSKARVILVRVILVRVILVEIPAPCGCAPADWLRIGPGTDSAVGPGPVFLKAGARLFQRFEGFECMADGRGKLASGV